MEPVDDGGAERPRIDFLDRARGWAIVGVVLVHSLSAVPGDGPSPPTGGYAALEATTGRLTLGRPLSLRAARPPRTSAAARR